jgi:hypothetical protein
MAIKLSRVNQLETLNLNAQEYAKEMLLIFEKKKIEAGTLRTEGFWQGCIETLETNPCHFSSIIENRFRKTQDFKIQRATVADMALKLKSLQMKNWKPKKD